jgi:hypothetical protein
MNINVNLEVTEDSVKDLTVAYLLHLFEVNKDLPIDNSLQLQASIKNILEYIMDPEDYEGVLADLQ